MDDRRNYYRVLHLQPDAAIALVRVNYRTLMQKLGAHPDLGGENWTAAHLNAAYRTLSDPKRRAEYDRELLSRYDIEVIAQGSAKPKARSAKQSRRSAGNRRNYYRVLQAQHDAPEEILEGSHRALRAAHPEDAQLLDEALALLSNRDLRATYDRLLAVCGHVDALRRMRMEIGDNSGGYDPVITSYCAFCKTPHTHAGKVDADVRCLECQSPLFPPPPALLGLARRTLARLECADPVTLYLDWPAAGIAGQATDLSPTGMRCSTTALLDVNDVVKVDAERFEAVGAVAHLQPCGPQVDAGLRFLTVRFPQTRGNFRTVKA